MTSQKKKKKKKKLVGNSFSIKINKTWLNDKKRIRNDFIKNV